MKRHFLCIFACLLLFAFLGCKKKKIETSSSGSTFKVIPEYERPYVPKNIKRVAKINVENAVYIYIQHLKEQIEWNKRITYMLNKHRSQESSSGNNRTSGAMSSSSSENYGGVDPSNADIFNKYKKDYEDIFFKTIGVSREKWEKFFTQNYMEVVKYRSSHPEIEAEIKKYSKAIQEQMAPVQ